MKQSALTLILPITGEENASWLEKELTSIGQQLGKAPKIDFSKSSLTHFARFVILPVADPNSKAKRLLFTSNLDGDLDGYAKELIDKGIAPGLDAIFSKCGGYQPGTLLTEGNAAAFLNSNNIDSKRCSPNTTCGQNGTVSIYSRLYYRDDGLTIGDF